MAGQGAAQTTLATIEACTTPASATKEHIPPAKVHTTPAEATKVRAMPKCTTRRGGVVGPHARGNVGRQVANGQDNMPRGGALGPHAHGHAARHGVDNLDVKESGQQKLSNDPRNN